MKGIALKGAEAAPDLEEAYEQEPEGPEDEEAVVEEGDDMTKVSAFKGQDLLFFLLSTKVLVF